MISFITGKPGGGKGLATMREVEQILVNSDMPIITNLAIRVNPWLRCRNKKGSKQYEAMKGLRAHLLEKYGKDFDCERRIRFLEPEQVSEFYLYRLSGPAAKVVRDDKGRVVEFETAYALASGPVCYIIDEAWKEYGARQWQDTGKGVLFYTAQHRKFGDRVILVTQHTRQIDTALRQVGEDYWVVTNHVKKRIGVFRQPAIFSVSIFDQPPTAGVTCEPMARSVFKMDLSLAASYDTSAGSGVGGGVVADLGEKAKGLPPWVIPVAVVLVGLGLVGLAMAMGKGAGTLLTGGVKKSQEVVATVRPEAQASLLGFGLSAPVLPVVKPASVKTNVPLPRVVGLAMVSAGSYWVMLSDGSSYKTGDPGLEEIRHDKVRIRGVWLQR